MEETNLYKDIAERTKGCVYVGVVGPVRTGKSTFIKKFMENMVIPHIKGESEVSRATDELPQSASGRTIMTTEPKFIPEEAAEISLEGNINFKVRLIDCVGYIVPSALGYIENEQPRMVMTPWYDREIPFNMAAEIGTQKVITEHSTIGLVVTTDGSICDIKRADYIEAEERVIRELSEYNKPFIVLVNSVNPEGEDCKRLCRNLRNKYSTQVMAVNCAGLTEEKIGEILKNVLMEFPVKEIHIDVPGWIMNLQKDHSLKRGIYEKIGELAEKSKKMLDMNSISAGLSDCEYIEASRLKSLDLGRGCADIGVDIPKSLFYKVLGETTGIDICGEEELFSCIAELAQVKRKYDKISTALAEVEATGYGIVMPTIDELSLEEPEIVKQGGRYGVRLRASAPSIHMMSANITTEVAPIVGSEKQSEELVHYLLQEFQEKPEKIWESNIFGKSLNELVNEGLRGKLCRMPQDARMKLQETIERIINEGCSGLICIIL